MYESYRDLKRAQGKNSPCRSCSSKSYWTEEIKSEKSLWLKNQRAVKENPWNTDEAIAKKRISLQIAHAKPDSYWKSEEFLSFLSKRAKKLSAEGKHPFQNLSEEIKNKAIEKSKISRSDPDSRWKKRIAFRHSPEGQKEASFIAKKFRAENEVFHTEEYKEKNRSHLMTVRKFVKKKNVSKHERELGEALASLDNSFVLNEYQFYIGRYYPDIYSQKHKMIVEFNGDFVHSNPLVYQPLAWNPIKNAHAKDVWESDQKRTKFLESQGWKVLIVWQSEWKSSKRLVLDRIMEFTSS